MFGHANDDAACICRRNWDNILGDGTEVHKDGEVETLYRTFKTMFKEDADAFAYLDQYAAKYPFDGETPNEALLAEKVSGVAEKLQRLVRPPWHGRAQR